MEAAGEAHEIEKVGKTLRGMMPWMKEKVLVNKQVN
jgi:ketol-acid reductoisomerase